MVRNTNIIQNDARYTNDPGLEVADTVTLNQATNRLIEEVISKDKTVVTRTSRNKQGYVKNKLVKMSVIRQVPKLVKLDAINNGQIKSIIKNGIAVEDVLKVERTISTFNILSMAHQHNSIKHALEAAVSISMKNTLAAQSKISAGLEVQTPETLDLIEEARLQFSMTEDTPIHTVEIDANETRYIRWSEEEIKTGETRYSGVIVRQMGLEDGHMWQQKTTLGINNNTIHNLAVGYIGRYCPAPCKKTIHSTAWANNNNGKGGCAICGTKRAEHNRQNLRIILPFVNMSKASTKSGFIDFRVVKMPKALGKLLNRVHAGHADASEFIEAICNSRSLFMNGHREQSHVALPCKVVKTAFDVINSNVSKPVLGLACMVKTSNNMHL